MLLALLGLIPGPLTAQLASGSLALRLGDEPDAAPLFPEPLIHSASRYVVIRLAENRLYLLEGNGVVWSAQVATGTGFRLESAGRAWTFNTPRGVFRVQRKEKDPIWIKPDWAFVKEGQAIPALDSPLRRQKGMLGTTAVYIGYELAMHGTDNPALVLQSDPEERRVSHGCIRLTNEDARILYHLVDVGTPVVIY